MKDNNCDSCLYYYLEKDCIPPACKKDCYGYSDMTRLGYGWIVLEDIL